MGKLESSMENFGVLRVSMRSTRRKVVVAFAAYVRGEGRITIPKELRDAQDLKEGDLVECRIKKIK